MPLCIRRAAWRRVLAQRPSRSMAAEGKRTSPPPPAPRCRGPRRGTGLPLQPAAALLPRVPQTFVYPHLSFFLLIGELLMG